jgi:mercuric ion binding protein
MNRTLITLLLALAGSIVNAQDKEFSSIVIRTSSVCDMCERTIEEELIYTKGVKSVDLDLASGLVSVQYDARKVSPDKIRTDLTLLGYAADDIPGDAKAFAKLPACCQKEGCGKVPGKKE